MKKISVILLTAILAAPDSTAQDPFTNPENRLFPDIGFEGRYGLQARVMANASNFSFHPAALSNSQQPHNFSNMRLRAWANLGALRSDGFGFYSQFEFGHLPFGSGGDGPKRIVHGGDNSGVELRRGFLWAMVNDQTQVRLGFQGWSDMFNENPTHEPFHELNSIDNYNSFQSLLANPVWDFNVAGLHVLGALSDATSYRFGTFILEQGDRTFTGEGGAVLLTGDIDTHGSAGSLGSSLYYLKDNGEYSYGTFGGPQAVYESSQDLWLGLRGRTDWYEWSPSLDLIFNQGGTTAPDWDHQGWAGRLVVSRPFEQGTLTFLLAASTGDDGNGDSGEFRTIAQSERDNFGAQSYWSLLPLTSPHGPSDVNDLGVSIQNRGLGLRTVQAGWHQPLNDRWSTDLVAGWLAAAEDNPTSGAQDMGLEGAAMLSWNSPGGFGIQFGAAYLLTGDFYASAPGASPEDLFELFFRMQMEF